MDSRELIIRLKKEFRKKEKERIPWTLDFGACKGMLWPVMLDFKKEYNINSFLPEYFDYDIMISLDPDRIYNDKLDYISEDFKKKKISQKSLIGIIPLSMHEDYD